MEGDRGQVMDDNKIKLKLTRLVSERWGYRKRKNIQRWIDMGVEKWVRGFLDLSSSLNPVRFEKCQKFYISARKA